MKKTEPTGKGKPKAKKRTRKRAPRTVGGLRIETRPFTQSRLVADPEARKKLLTALRAGASLQAAAASAGISRSSVYRTLAQGRDDVENGVWSPHAEVTAEILQARGDAHVGLVAIVSRSARNGDWRAAAWLLERLERGGRLHGVPGDPLLDEPGSAGVSGPTRLEVTVVATRELTPDEFLAGIRADGRESGESGGDAL